ncbi:cell division protein FtsQ/DivIB [Paenibacillus sacheonensis]|uniref:Cell division protein DivIB n=1 Tax=Paenibacillus sacheonensis TaxID=742054 RepID=A0A7X4YV80_9BACL|nr:FtsQ-type POTRA domain-containing protein [Paenibacillus sacheonensis]MBM7565711.1 cell division protein FtsQ [Paenibacillus sacheonensis]NBC72231.1 FtsQ-type POTRA domain-containing protein [Paenibacillus sacheonensis]
MHEKMPVLREPVKRRRVGKKLLAVLVLLFIVLLGVLFFNSSISKVSTVTVEGQKYLQAVDLRKTAGIVAGDSFFATSSADIEGRIRTLKPVKSVTVTKSFPGSITIHVQEYETVAYSLSNKGELSAVLANGIAVPAGTDALVDKPVLSGWKANDPVLAELCKALASIPDEALSDFSEISPDPSQSYPDRIQIYTRTRFEVITAVSLLPEKIATMNAVIEIQPPGMITLLLADKYAPFVPEEAENSAVTQKETTQ